MAIFTYFQAVNGTGTVDPFFHSLAVKTQKKVFFCACTKYWSDRHRSCAFCIFIAPFIKTFFEFLRSCSRAELTSWCPALNLLRDGHFFEPFLAGKPKRNTPHCTFLRLSRKLIIVEISELRRETNYIKDFPKAFICHRLGVVQLGLGYVNKRTTKTGNFSFSFASRPHRKYFPR